MVSRVLIISAINCVIIITIIFINLFTSQVYDLNIEKQRSEEYLSSLIYLELNKIKDEIIFSYLQLAAWSKELREDQWDGDLYDIESYLGKINQEDNFPKILSNGHIVKLESPRDFVPLTESTLNIQKFARILANMEVSDIEYNSNKIYINNFKGFMSFPIIVDSNQISALLMMDLDLMGVINEYLPTVIENSLLSYELDKNNLSDNFKFNINTGSVINKTFYREQPDLIIDLNAFFYIRNLKDYYFDKLVSNNLSLLLKNGITTLDNHLYLYVTHKDGNLTAFYKDKYKNILLRYIVQYLILIFSIIILFYTTYKIRMNIQREEEFTSLISHELKTPLSVIKLGSQNLAEGRIKNIEDVRYYGEMIAKETDRLHMMMENILLLSTKNWSSKKNQLLKEQLSLIINELRTNNQYLLQQYNITLNISCDSTSKYIKCNKNSFVASINNVIQNGIRYGAAFSEDKILYIHIYDEHKKGKNGIVFNIRDHGPGIQRKKSSLIFKPFYRGKETREKQLSGSGLGLSLTKRIIKEHKGTITYQKKFKKETSFKIWIPNRTHYEKGITN